MYSVRKITGFDRKNDRQKVNSQYFYMAGHAISV